MARVIVINSTNTFAHVYESLDMAAIDSNLPRNEELTYFLESGVPLALPATIPTPSHLAKLQKRLAAVKDELLRWISLNPPELGSNETVATATTLVNSYVQNGVVSLELFRAYPVGLPDHRGNFIHNWLHH